MLMHCNKITINTSLKRGKNTNKSRHFALIIRLYFFGVQLETTGLREKQCDINVHRSYV